MRVALEVFLYSYGILPRKANGCVSDLAKHTCLMEGGLVDFMPLPRFASCFLSIEPNRHGR